MGYDRRIGFEFLFPGVGYGGSCFPKDVKALVQTAGNTMSMPGAQGGGGGERSPEEGLFQKIVSSFHGQNRERGTGERNRLPERPSPIWGLSFKPRTDDMREAPSMVIINSLLRAGARVTAHDPVAMNEAYKIFKDRIVLAEDGYEAAQGGRCLAVVTEWNEFRTPDFLRMKKLMKTPVIFDGRNIFNREELQKDGLHLLRHGKNLTRAVMQADGRETGGRMNMRILVTGGAGFLGRTSASGCSGKVTRSSAWTIFSPAGGRTSTPILLIRILSWCVMMS